MGNKNLIITIEREYGSGGRIVGRKLAEELGLHFYDDEILKMASEKSAVGEEFFRLADEKAGNNLDQDEEIENLVRIFVYADRVRRVQRVMEVDCISEERAKKRIRKIENERKNYYKYFTGNDWKNMKNYDLPINTTRLGLDETAELIKEYVKLRGYMK